MFVIKRDGTRESVKFDKITARIQKLKRVAKFVHRRKQLLGCFTLRPRLEPAIQVGFGGAAHAAGMLQG